MKLVETVTKVISHVTTQKSISYSTAPPTDTRYSTHDRLLYKFLDLTDDNEEIKQIDMKVRKKSQGISSQYSISAILRIYKTNTQALLTNFKTPFIASNIAELNAICDVVRNWCLKVKTPATPNATSTPKKGQDVKKNGSEKSKLNQFLRSTSVDWLHPTSYHPNLCDNLSNSLNRIASSSSEKAINDNETTPDGLDDFLQRYSAQHTASVSSPRVYYCIEERKYTCSPGGLYPSTGDSAGSKDHLEDISDPSIEALNYLQDLYAKQQKHSLLPGGVQAIRENLNNGSLMVVEMTGIHRSNFDERSLSPGAAQILRSYPDIVKVADSMGNSYHFAPAMILNLAETAYFKDNHLNDRISDVMQSCPHPYLPLLSSCDKSLVPIESMYCLVRFTPLKLTPTSSIKKSKKGAVAPDDMDNTDLRKSSEASTSSVSSLLAMIPLVEECMQELTSDNILLTLNDKNDEQILNNTPPTSSPPSNNGYKSLSLLPDHARNRLRLNTGSCSHKYALVDDIVAFTANSTNGDQVSSSIKKKQYLYFIQYVDRGADNAVRNDTDDNKTVNSDDDDAYSADFCLEDELQPNIDISLHARDDSLLKSILAARSSHVPSTPASRPASGSSVTRGQIDSNADMGSNVDAIEGTDALYDDDSTANSKRKWDPKVLSTICRWRSCICEADTNNRNTSNSSKFLCPYHAELKSFLDNLPATGKSGSNESAKYLPKRPPNVALIGSDEKKDLVIIRAASTLLQELWDGKLRATLKSFTKKTVQEMSLKRRMEVAINTQLAAISAEPTISGGNGSSKSPPKKPTSSINEDLQKALQPPSWAMWRNTALLQETVDSIASYENSLQGILELEKSLTEELNALCEFKVFPSVELQLIKKEVKAFKEYQDQQKCEMAAEGTDSTSKNGNTAVKKLITMYQSLANNSLIEQRVCEKKLSIVRSRRQDEQELRNQYLRKMARLKAMEEKEAKDPYNFRNQKNY